MRDSKISYHRLIDYQEHVAFTKEDGINDFGESLFPTCLNCGHTELPIEVKEMLDLVQSEKRKNPQSPSKLYVLTRDFP